MNSRIAIIIRYILVCTLGTLLHFTYEWSDNNYIVGLFSAVNESTWEHLKLIFFPMLLLTLWDLFYNPAKDEYFIQARTVGILCGMASIVALFYTLWGLLGRLYEWLNISLFFVGVFVAFWVEKKAYKRKSVINSFTCFAILFYFLFGFIAFTKNSPDMGIFYDFAKIGPNDYFQ